MGKSKQFSAGVDSTSSSHETTIWGTVGIIRIPWSRSDSSARINYKYAFVVFFCHQLRPSDSTAKIESGQNNTNCLVLLSIGIKIAIIMQISKLTDPPLFGYIFTEYMLL